MKKITLATIATLFVLMFGCKPEGNNLPYEADNLNLPAQAMDYSFPTESESGGIKYQSNPNNPITNQGATLGRVLFYDKKLSLNNQVACASCHHQDQGFADNVRFSTGFQGAKTTRNALALNNAILDKSLFWDNRSPNLEELALEPVRNHIEMGIEDMDKLAIKLSKISYYPELFEKAFGSKEVSGDKISKAMAQFLGSLVTYRSKFDEGKKNNFIKYTSEETRGKNLFMKELHCANCHGGDNFNKSIDNELAFNIGLDQQYKDNGIGALTGDNKKNGKFKVPSLRNVAVTGPYMHDGRFATLEEVVEHYNSTMQNHTNLFPSFRSFTWQGNGGGINSGGSGGWGGSSFNSFAPRGLNLQENDKKALVAFMKTLTDEKLMKEEKFSNPFQN
jgi:cytochrome c peroxidase